MNAPSSASRPRPLNLLLTALVGLGLGCDSASQPVFEAPQHARQFDAQPLHPNAANMAEHGRELFSSRCGSCHGASGEGRVGIGPRLASPSFLAAASDDMLIKTIKNGRAGTTMTPWGTILSPDDLSAITAYIRAMVPHERVELDERPLAGNVEAGAETFNTICASCHGRNGGGYIESSSGTGIGRQAFLDVASDGYLRHIIKNGKTLSQMKAFKTDAPTAVANLDDQQIDDVIAYLRKNAW